MSRRESVGKRCRRSPESSVCWAHLIHFTPGSFLSTYRAHTPKSHLPEAFRDHIILKSLIWTAVALIIRKCYNSMFVICLLHQEWTKTCSHREQVNDLVLFLQARSTSCFSGRPVRSRGNCIKRWLRRQHFKGWGRRTAYGSLRWGCTSFVVPNLMPHSALKCLPWQFSMPFPGLGLCPKELIIVFFFFSNHTPF